MSIRDNKLLFKILFLIIATSFIALYGDKIKYTKNQSEVKNEVSLSNNQSENILKCSNTKEQKTAVDELSMLLQNQNENPDSCLFVGCSGFF